jgi:hypothetical protein
VGGKLVILMVVDRLSKYAHFIPLAHPYTVETVARVFFVEIVHLHGTQFLPLHFGKLSVPLVPNCICPLCSTHNQMVRQKQSIKQLGYTFAV